IGRGCPGPSLTGLVYDPSWPRGACAEVVPESIRRAGVPEANVGRLPLYLRALTTLHDQGITSISSEALASHSGVRSTQLRKDLSHLGSYGVRGVGYDVELLAAQIAQELGLTQQWPVVIVGMGNLGREIG